MEESPIMNDTIYMGEVEDAYEKIFNAWINGEELPEFPQDAPPISPEQAKFYFERAKTYINMDTIFEDSPVENRIAVKRALYNLELADKEEFLKLAEDYAPFEYMHKHKDTFFAAEGFLFPDTYTVESDVEIEEILSLMANTFDEKLTASMRAQAAKMDLSIYDLITLASLVEREVRFPEDRAIVAQVLLKRLKMNMPLQTDATLQYLMDAPKEEVSIADTQIDSPYNTYQHVGLPPGPIANPGMAAIEAVLYPADTDYLYFVADRSGHNHYAHTYEEHLNLVNKYR